MTRLAGGGGMDLGLQRGRPENQNSVVRQGGGDVAHKPVLLFPWDVLQDVKRVRAVECPGERFFNHVMDPALKFPALVHAAVCVLDEYRVKIHRSQLADFLQHDPCSESVGASHLEDVLTAAEHLVDELVA